MKITTTKDKVGQIVGQIRSLTKNDVLVGIPDEKAPRSEEEAEAQKGEPINNATIGYVSEFGSPTANIPARPHLMPGIESVKDKIEAHLKKGALGALEGSPDAAEIALEKVGVVASSAVKAKITEGGFAPLAPATLKQRRARGRTGEKPLSDTGQYRNSITYVVRPKGK